MAEGTYEYECMRAELLGIEKPNYDEFVKRQKEQLAKYVEEERAETECLTVNPLFKKKPFYIIFIIQNAENANVTMGSISNRLDELNTILASTQKHISRFKVDFLISARARPLYIDPIFRRHLAAVSPTC